jgi:hypothetical protein
MRAGIRANVSQMCGVFNAFDWCARRLPQQPIAAALGPNVEGTCGGFACRANRRAWQSRSCSRFNARGGTADQSDSEPRRRGAVRRGRMSPTRRDNLEFKIEY